jgi:hypothetical protein
MSTTPPRKLRLANDSLNGGRFQSAALRAIDAYKSVGRVASKILEDIDDITPPLRGVPVTELADDDSMVVVVKAAIESQGKP